MHHTHLAYGIIDPNKGKKTEHRGRIYIFRVLYEKAHPNIFVPMVCVVFMMHQPLLYMVIY